MDAKRQSTPNRRRVPQDEARTVGGCVAAGTLPGLYNVQARALPADAVRPLSALPEGEFLGACVKSMLRVSISSRATCDDGAWAASRSVPSPHVITPALRGKGDDTPIITHRDCTSCGRCIDVCSQDVFRFTHRFDQQLTNTEVLAVLSKQNQPCPNPSGGNP